MRKPTPTLLSTGLLPLSLAVLLVASQACAALPNLPVSTQDLNFLGTAIMGTMISGATQTAAAVVTVSPVATATLATPPTSTATFTPEPPTLTPSATVSPTPVFTSTSAVPLISVSVATNCRTGPGKVYDRVGALLVGEVAEVIGRNPNGNYWYIRNPRKDGFCWLWGEYATLTGNVAALPIFTPPPTPTPMPDFEVSYDRLESCTGWWIDIRVANTGGLVFESISVAVRDIETDTVVTLYADAFTNLDGCSNSSSREKLNPGGQRTVSSSPFGYNPIRHRMRATITLCSRNGLNGICLTKTITFTPEGGVD